MATTNYRNVLSTNFIIIFICIPCCIFSSFYSPVVNASESYYCTESNYISITPEKGSLFSSKRRMIAKADNSPSKKMSLIFIPKKDSAIIHGNNRTGEFKQVGLHTQYLEIRPDGHANLWTFLPAKNNKLQQNTLILEKAFDESRE